LSSDFVSLSLAQPLLRALSDEGYTVPTPIQSQAIPPVLSGRDVLGCAQTGTGKTAAFALPILHRLLAAAPTDRKGPAKPRVLVLAPTRELATQIADSFIAYGRHASFRTAVIFGGVSQFHQVKALDRGVDILVATPGRLIDLMDQGIVKLDSIRTLVLDEADRMLDMGFIQPIRKIVAKLTRERQTLLFSATMPPEIMKLADALLREPVKVAVTPIASAAPKIEQALYHVPRTVKQALLHHLLGDASMERAVVFTKTKHGADRVAKKLVQAGISADAIHGNKAQNRRERTLEAFRKGSLRVLVATDLAARGLDVDDVSHVVNFDLPMEPEAYVHRIGRTGRAGKTGIAISFCDAEERGLLRDIERLVKKEVPQRPLPSLHVEVRAMAVASADAPERDDRRSRGERPNRRDASPSRGGGRPHGRRDQRTDRGTGERQPAATGSATAGAQSAVPDHRPVGILRRGQGRSRGR
jgi:ATP-dependent RNA helicase RhlE